MTRVVEEQCQSSESMVVGERWEGGGELGERKESGVTKVRVTRLRAVGEQRKQSIGSGDW